MSQSSVPRRSTPHTARRGLTLIELVVVLVILVALAGILVPLFPNMIQRAHGASGADNATEIFKAVQLHEALYNGQHPSDLDSLANGAGDALGGVVKTPATGGSRMIVRSSVDPQVTTALSALGITRSYTMLDPGPGINATFNANDGAAVDLTTATGTKIAILTGTGQTELGLAPDINSDPNGPLNYVVFGLGTKNTGIGKSMGAAPVRFLSQGQNPSETYARWLLVYEIPQTGPARLAAVAGIDSNGFYGLNGHLNKYYEAAQ